MQTLPKESQEEWIDNDLETLIAIAKNEYRESHTLCPWDVERLGDYLCFMEIASLLCKKCNWAWNENKYRMLDIALRDQDGAWEHENNGSGIRSQCNASIFWEEKQERFQLNLLREGNKPEITYHTDYLTCPTCNNFLEVDEEYMLGTYGSSYTYMPKSEWVFWCEECQVNL